LSIEDREEEEWFLPIDVELRKSVYELCLVGYFQTEDEEPMEVSLIFSSFWIQAHDLPPDRCLKAFEAKKENYALSIGIYLSAISLREEEYAIWEKCDMRQNSRDVIRFKNQADKVKAGSSSGIDRADIEKDMEDSLIESRDGKKRLMSENMVFSVSVFVDSLRSTNERIIAQVQQRLAAVNRQAGRE
ncbi:hypothetical protein Godav_026936, partial [Gossypium davidsonii]|nr:hypothetical protein [Gossypium davidsonii]MBA0652822.1 hypothetical protein [Gossypium klotzschianum]